MSLDGYIAGSNDQPATLAVMASAGRTIEFGTPEGNPSRPGRRTGGRLIRRPVLLVGRSTVEQIDQWRGNHHGVRIFKLSHRPPGPSVANYPW
jgi:hypothetical protein